MAGFASVAVSPVHVLAQKPVATDVPTASSRLSNYLARAARNNAIWCDAVCRAHDLPGEFHETLWLTRQGTPRFYPDVVTTAGAEAAQTQLAVITSLVGSRRQREWFVKDSFNCLSLQPLGFLPLFDAEWIAISGARPVIGYQESGQRPTVVNDEAGLNVWEQSWARTEAGPTGALPRVFNPRLLADNDIRFVSIRGDNALPAGGILNRGAGVVGITNVYGAKIAGVWPALVELANEIFPGLPLVGYEHGDDLEAAKLAGFEEIGSLRIWRLPKAR